jgi:hypothetical protein
MASIFVRKFNIFIFSYKVTNRFIKFNYPLYWMCGNNDLF